MLRFVVVAAVMVGFVTPAWAEFYLVQEASTKKCRIANTKPDGQAMVMIGSEGYESREKAKAAKKAAAECQSETRGSSDATSGDTNSSSE